MNKIVHKKLFVVCDLEICCQLMKSLYLIYVSTSCSINGSQLRKRVLLGYPSCRRSWNPYFQQRLYIFFPKLVIEILDDNFWKICTENQFPMVMILYVLKVKTPPRIKFRLHTYDDLFIVLGLRFINMLVSNFYFVYCSNSVDAFAIIDGSQTWTMNTSKHIEKSQQ